jgi:hypothetical protein
MARIKSVGAGELDVVSFSIPFSGSVGFAMDSFLRSG